MATTTTTMMLLMATVDRAEEFDDDDDGDDDDDDDDAVAATRAGQAFAVRCVSACPQPCAACSRALSQRQLASLSVIQKPSQWNALPKPFSGAAIWRSHAESTFAAFSNCRTPSAENAPASCSHRSSLTPYRRAKLSPFPDILVAVLTLARGSVRCNDRSAVQTSSKGLRCSCGAGAAK